MLSFSLTGNLAKTKEILADEGRGIDDLFISQRQEVKCKLPRVSNSIFLYQKLLR